MFVVAAKAGIGFSVILIMLGALQSQTLSDMFVAFLTAGILPGTDLQIPAELSLIFVAGALMLLAAWLFKLYLADRRRILLASQDYPKLSEDPGFEPLIQSTRRMISARRRAEDIASDFSLKLYFWMRSLERPLTAQAIAASKGLITSFMRFNAVSFGKAELRAFAENATSAAKTGATYWQKTLGQTSEKARAYLAKFILS